MFPLSRWQSAMNGAHAEAQRLRLGGLTREASLIDQTLARSFAPLLADLGESGGWQRAIAALVNLDAPLPLDAVAGEDFALPSVRVGAILALPDVGEISIPEDIALPIGAAIRVGAPIYNDGDTRSCGIIYWATAFALVSASTTRGFNGQARAVRLLRGAVEERMPTIGNLPSALSDFAWRMRHALDATLEALR